MSETLEDAVDKDDPRIAGIYRKMRMLVTVSMLVMGLGFAAVVGVIIYRLSVAAPAPTETTETSLALPEGSRILGIAADGGVLYVMAEYQGKTSVHMVDGRTLKRLGRLDATGSPAPIVPMPGTP
jgi:hypothetical protein